jgi:iron-sulfur cluster repair protein YtfE (RIC family)
MKTNDIAPPAAPARTVDPLSTVNDVLLRHPAAAKVFAAFGVHTCCGGGNPLGVAARDAGIEPAVLVEALECALAGEG